MKTALVTKNNICISWASKDRSEWVATLDAVKTIPGRRFDVAGKLWHAPLSDEALSILRGQGFTLQGDVPKKERQKKKEARRLDLSDFPAAQKLFPYQREGVQWLLDHPRALLADSMGLGKTCQTIFSLEADPSRYPVLVITPASLKLNWCREFEMWAGKSATIINGKTESRHYGEITIINYDILEAHVPALKKQGYKTVVIEEAHFAKSRSAKRTKAVQAVCKGIENVVAISGTPIVNRPSEFFTILNILDPYRFPDFWHFGKKYCGAKHNGFGWDFSGSTNTEELHELLTTTFMIRRRKEDVLTELPDKTRAVIPMLNGKQDEYREAREELIAALSGEHRDLAIVLINKLRQIAAHAKMEEALEWIGDFLDTGEKLVVFGIHHAIIDKIVSAFQNIVVKLDGRDTQEQRQTAVDRFQNDDKVKLFVGNVKAAGVGITLTAASNVAFVELPWSPGDLEQAIDRCHRIGQKNAVTAWFLVAEGTIEEEVAGLLDSKRKQLDAVLDGRATDETTLISELLANFYKEKVK